MSRFEHIVVGSGAGGCAAAYRLVQAGRRVLLLEAGPRLEDYEAAQNAALVIGKRQFLANFPFFHGDQVSSHQEYLNVGGKTKWYGATLARLTKEEFASDPSHQCPAWPLQLEDLEPFYAEAESVLNVRQPAPGARLRAVLEKIRGKDASWTVVPQPIGLHDEVISRSRAHRFDGFALPFPLKGEGETSFLHPILDSPNFQVLTGCTVTRLLEDPADPTRIRGVRCADGREFHADESVILAAGALRSPLLLKDYVDEKNLESSIAGAKWIGCFYKCHIASYCVVSTLREQEDAFRKAAFLRHPDFPHSIVQTGNTLDPEWIAARLRGRFPSWLAHAAGRRSYVFNLMTEEGSHPENRVRAGAAPGSINLQYDQATVPEAQREHQALKEHFAKCLRSFDTWVHMRPTAPFSTAHACGTLIAGNDPERSVVDAAGAVHGITGLHVVDGSAMTRIGRENPALTIFAWALRVATRVAEA